LLGNKLAFCLMTSNLSSSTIVTAPTVITIFMG
jgi:hypothetical protein